MKKSLSKSEVKRVYREAYAAGLAAGKAKVPTPMVVSQRLSPLDDRSPVVRQWAAMGGVCGFAWVNVRPANGRMAKYMLELGVARKSDRGVKMFVHEFGQSYEQKVAFASAFASVLAAAGVDAYADDRLD